MQHEIDVVLQSLTNRRDAISLRAARLIRSLQNEVSLAHAKGWNGALTAAIAQVSPKEPDGL
jgi:hypothetical protein